MRQRSRPVRNLSVCSIYEATGTSLRVVFLSRFPLLSASTVGSPAGAKEITRLFPAIQVDVPGTTRDPLLIAAHLKSGTGSDDRFRRAVEMRRLTDYLGAQGLTSDDNYVIMGDFNLSSTNKTYAELPSGLPGTFSLGADILFPITYSTNPLSYFSSPAVTRLDPRQLDTSASTYESGSVIDLFLVSPAIAGRPLGMEIYNSTLDTSNSSGLVKSGLPLAAGTSAAASDHYALFADFELDSDYPNLDLTLSAASVSEDSADGTVMLTVTLPAVRGTAVTVSITSDDPAAVSPVSPTLTIAAGEISGSQAIRTTRNFLQEENRSVSLTASTSGYDPDSAVLQVLDVDVNYVFSAPGQIITEMFTGFDGTHDPAPWVSSGAVWKGADAGTSALAGFRAYGPVNDSSLGFLPAIGSGTATANFTNQSNAILTAMRISFTAEQWRAAFGGTADKLGVELIMGGSVVALPDLAFDADIQLPSGAIAGGISTAKEVTLGGLAVAPGASFDVRFAFTPGEGGGVPPADIFVNEFHYDNLGTDEGEFIEIVVGPGFSGQLSDIDVLLYRSTNGTVYNTLNLGVAPFALLNTVSGFKFMVADLPSGGLQNGPNGIALVNKTTQQLIHFLSYEGSSITAVEGLPVGAITTSTVISATQNGSEAVGGSALGLIGTGSMRDDFDWLKIGGVFSKGQPNAGQTFELPTLPPQGIAIDNFSIEFLIDTDGDGDPDLTDPDDDNDGISDADEFVFGTDPLDSNSRYAMTLEYPSPLVGMVKLTFPTATGRSYMVESSLNLTNWSDVATYAGTGNPQVADIPVDPEEGERFYRIRAVLP